MKTLAGLPKRPAPSRGRLPISRTTTPAGLRLLAILMLIGSLASAIVSVPVSPARASSQDCGDGQVWDDTQQQCVDPTPDGSNPDQAQPADTTGDSPTMTETPTPTAATTTATGSLVVSTFACPAGYAPGGPGANPVTDCTTPLDGVQLTWRGADGTPVLQSTAGGTTTFTALAAGTFTLDGTASAGSSFVGWQCQGTMSQPSAGQGGSIAGQIADGEQMTCSIALLVPPSAAGTPTTRASLAGPSGSPVTSLVGPGTGPGSIRIVMDMCPAGFDPAAAGADAAKSCGDQYRFVAYPIAFTAIATSSDTSTPGTQDTFLGWVTFDNLQPDTYRVQAPIPAGISSFIDRYGTCGEAVSLSGGLVAFSMKIAAGGFAECTLAAVRDPAAPTPTRAPSTDSSSLSFATAMCPAGFDAGTGGSLSACVAGPAGIQYTLSGPAGSASAVSVSAPDSLSIRAVPGTYTLSFTLPDGIASIAAGRCTPYDLHEQQWVDDIVLAPTMNGRDVTASLDVPGAMIVACTIYAVPTGPSPTPTSSPTQTPTITPTPTATQPMTSSQPSGQPATGSQGAPATTGNGSAMQGGGQGGPANAGAAPTPTPVTSGGLAFVIDAFLCPVGVTYAPGSTVMPEGCLDSYVGAVFTVTGMKNGVSLRATVGDVLPGAAIFTDLPLDEYVITQQATPGILGSTGTCTLLGGNAQGAPVTPFAFQGSLQQVFDATPRVFTCNWYSIPDATFGGLPTPAAPQGVSLTVHAFTCPVGYDPSGADARPATDCLEPARTVTFSLAGATSGTTTEQTTGTSSGDPNTGTSLSGTVTFSGLAADTWTLAQADPAGPPQAFITSCSLATAQDAAVPIYPTVANGSIQYQLNDNESLTCLWYIVPTAGATTQGAAGSGQGGATDDAQAGAAQASQPQAGAAASDAATSNSPSTLYLFTYQCPAGYSPTAAGANPAGDCTTPLDGLAVTITGKASGTSSSVKTGDAFPGGLMLGGVAADTYHLAPAVATGETIVAIPCDVSGAQDGSAQPPITLEIASTGESDLVVPADRTISCTWYIVPAASAARPGATGSVASAVIDRHRDTGVTPHVRSVGEEHAGLPVAQTSPRGIARLRRSLRPAT